ncbi:MAG: glycoside hydrolase family 57 protein [Anaerolineae bacterium]|nr:glycoside hydrolase family 57 protein [Anaerolineae bacterium]
MTHPLYVAIIWHMHQPFYRDLRAGEISLPWLRLHAAKDYLHMADVLADHPDAHATINMVPSLVEQMLAWAEGRELDQLARLAEADSWTDAERRVILNLGFSISWDKVIRRHRRYAELLDRRPQALAEPRAFSDADYRDLLGWFNMVWIDPDWLAHDRELCALWARGRGFSTADLRLIHAKQRQIASAVLPAYRRLAERGQLEITTSPYYHPILPLLADTESARRPSPGLPLPAGRLIAPEDAAAQLRLAVEAHTAWFGAPPQGLWPSEGAVSPEILPLVTAAGFTWLATDEAILGRSLGRSFDRDGRNLVINPHALYRPYRVLADSELGPYVVFRDHELSDRIGFLYQNFPPEQAAEDFIYRLLEIRNRLNDPGTPYLVSVILDGENAWEHYERNGTPFLHALYAGLSRRAELKAVTVGEYLREFGPRPAATLARLATGSWISGDLTTWIGDPEHNRAWDALIATRAIVAQIQREQPHHAGLPRAWQALYAAEGSDWFWWYSHRNNSDQNPIFDRLFRDDLAAVFEALDRPVPAWLDVPISAAPLTPSGQPATRYLAPVLAATPYAGERWAGAATVLPAAASSGAMQRADGVIERLLVGHDPQTLSLRLELRARLDDYETAIYLGRSQDGSCSARPRVHLADDPHAPQTMALDWEIRRLPGQAEPFLARADGRGGWLSSGPVRATIGEKAIEVAISLATLELELGQDIDVLAMVGKAGQPVAALPGRSAACLELRRF